MENIKAFAFATVNRTKEATMLDIRACVAPSQYNADAPFAFKTKNENDRRFAELTAMPSTVRSVTGKYWLGYARAEVSAGLKAGIKEVPGGGDYVLKPADNDGERLLASLQSFRGHDAIKDHKRKWEMKEFDSTSKALTIRSEMQCMMLEVVLDHPFRASAFDVVHWTDKGDKIGTLTFLFLPTTDDAARAR